MVLGVPVEVYEVILRGYEYFKKLVENGIKEPVSFTIKKHQNSCIDFFHNAHLP